MFVDDGGTDDKTETGGEAQLRVRPAKGGNMRDHAGGGGIATDSALECGGGDVAHLQVVRAAAAAGERGHCERAYQREGGAGCGHTAKVRPRTLILVESSRKRWGGAPPPTQLFARASFCGAGRRAQRLRSRSATAL